MQLSMAFRQIFSDKLVLITLIALSTANNTKNDTTMFHFSDTVIPLRYKVYIKVFYKENMLIGECNIIINITSKTTHITAHSLNLNIYEIVLTNYRNKTWVPSFVITSNMLVLDFTTTLSRSKLEYLRPGIYSLRIIYARNIIDKITSFFGSIYPDEIGDEILNARDIEIIKTREILVCFNESTCKATFAICIMHPTIYKALSNMPIHEQTAIEDDVDMQWTHFDESPRISADNITLMITKFVPISDSNSTVVFWCRRHEIEKVSYANKIASAVINHIINVTEGNITVKRLDYIAAWGENDSENKITEGFIFHRITDILYTQNLDHFMQQVNVEYLIAQQMVHFCYDGVFPFVKQGFDIFFGVYLLDQISLEYRVIDLFVVQMQQESLRLNDLFISKESRKFQKNFKKTSKKKKKTHKTRKLSKIRKADKIDRSKINRSRRAIRSSNHVTVSYNEKIKPLYDIKLFTLWRMVQHLTPPDVFWSGIHAYTWMNTRKLKHIWTIMQTFLNKKNNTYRFNIRKVIKIWEKTEYYPVLIVKRNYKNSSMEISYVKSVNIFDNNKTKDWIPVTYTTQSQLDFQNTNVFWLNSISQSYEIVNISNNDWVIFNIQQIGYYRVNYDTENWLKLARYLKIGNYIKIHVINRAQIVDDAFYFLLQKKLNWITFWEIIRFLSQDTTYIAWHPMFKALEYMVCVFPQMNLPSFLKNVKPILEDLLLKIDYYNLKDENLLTNSLREEAIKWACIFHIPTCMQKAVVNLEKHFETDIAYTPLTWKQWIYCKGHIPENYYKWEHKWNKWNASDYRYLEFFTCAATSEVFIRFWLHSKIQRFFSLIEANKHANVFLLMIAKHANNDKMLNYILQQFKLIKPTRVSTIATLIVIITNVHDVFLLEEVRKFVRKEVQRSYPNVLEILRYANKKIKKRRHENTRKFSYMNYS